MFPNFNLLILAEKQDLKILDHDHCPMVGSFHKNSCYVCSHNRTIIGHVIFSFVTFSCLVTQKIGTNLVLKFSVLSFSVWHLRLFGLFLFRLCPLPILVHM